MICDIVTGIISGLITNRIQKNIEIKDDILLKEEVSIGEEKLSKVPKIQSYTDEVAERLNISVEQLNTNEKSLSASLICDFLNYKSVSEVEDFFLGKKEPSLEFLKDYSNFFGLELDWLRHGKGSVFLQLNQYETYPLGYRTCVNNLNPKEIYFVRSEGDSGYSGIILKLSNYKYLTLPSTYMICGNVGATGNLQIESFFDLIESLSLNHSGKINGLFIGEKVFSDLFCGKIYPGKVIKSARKTSYWWDDFLDYEHKLPISKGYEHLYGISFIKAQQIVKLQKERTMPCITDR